MLQSNLKYENMANSSILEIISEHTYVPLVQTAKNQYNFFLTDVSYLPVQIKKRYWSEKQCVLTFDYKCSSFISHIGIQIKSKEIMVRNIEVARNWKTLSIDLADYKDLLGYYILTQNSSMQLIVAPIVASEAILFQIKNIRLRARTPEEQK